MPTLPMSKEQQQLHKQLLELPPACISGFGADSVNPPSKPFGLLRRFGWDADARWNTAKSWATR